MSSRRPVLCSQSAYVILINSGFFVHLQESVLEYAQSWIS